MSKENRKVYDHNGEQSTFYQKLLYISKHIGWKKKNDFVIFVLQYIPIYLTKTVPKTKTNVTFNMKEVDLDES